MGVGAKGEGESGGEGEDGGQGSGAADQVRAEHASQDLLAVR